jgi:hypothetical protein
MITKKENTDMLKKISIIAAIVFPLIALLASLWIIVGENAVNRHEFKQMKITIELLQTKIERVEMQMKAVDEVRINQRFYMKAIGLEYQEIGK